MILTTPGQYQIEGVAQPTQLAISLADFNTPLPPWDGTDFRVDFFATITVDGTSYALHDWITNCNHLGCLIDTGTHNHVNIPISDPSTIFDITMGSNNLAYSETLMYFVVPTGTLVPAVPEPATWLMLLIGFVALSAARRRLMVHFAPAARAASS